MKNNIGDTVFDSLKEHVFSIDLNYCYTSFNKSHAQDIKTFTGTDIELGKSIFEYAPDLGNHKKIMAQLEKAFHDEKVTFEVLTGQKTASRRYFKVNCNPLHNSSGDVIGISFLAYDVTGIKKDEMIFRRLYETSQDGIMARDLEGNMITCNKAYSNMLGYSIKELEILRAQQLLPEKWHEPRSKIIKEVIETGHSVVFEREYLRKDGSIFPASVRTWRLTDDNGKILGTWSIIRDITMQKKLQNELEKHSEHLEEIIQERTKQLKDSERMVAIGQTAGMVGHDIRNPLQAIVSEVYLANIDLASMPERPEKKSLQESLLSIQKNIDYINKIVVDLQDFASPLNPVLEKTDFKRVINEAVTKFCTHDNIETEVDVDVEARNILVDSTYISRIICNLINNAVQAMPKGGKIIVHTNVDRRTKDVTLTVEDNGVGIPTDVKNKIFTPLFTTKSKGQGFGLAVVKRMTEALGGTVTFESEIGKGTKFTVCFPQKLSDNKF